MTGNSLDGADFVLSRFDDDGTITDLASNHVDFTGDLAKSFRHLRSCVESTAGDVEKSISLYNSKQNLPISSFDELMKRYIDILQQGVNDLIAMANSKKIAQFDKPDLIGFHGQTCAHYPPSIAKSREPNAVYTVQVGDGQSLADATGITVVYDFRSDDLMNGGEAAPLAPMHHYHLAKHAKAMGRFPLAFCNGGNTGNITIITADAVGDDVVLGWDTGPFNHYSDLLMQSEGHMLYDPEGQFGKKGNIDLDLLKCLFERAVVTKNGDNYLILEPPKSSDPTWYVALDEVLRQGGLTGKNLSFEDKLCTVQYFAAYAFVYGLSLLPQGLKPPLFYALCGGGWKNLNIRGYFSKLLSGDLTSCPVLPEHVQLFQELRRKLAAELSTPKHTLKGVVIEDATSIGYEGSCMEARLMADAAVSRIKGVPFSKPSITGTASDTVLGIIRFPHGDSTKASPRTQAALSAHQSQNLTIDRPETCDPRWSRASAGWFAKLGGGLG